MQAAKVGPTVWPWWMPPAHTPAIARRYPQENYTVPSLESRPPNFGEIQKWTFLHMGRRGLGGEVGGQTMTEGLPPGCCCFQLPTGTDEHMDPKTFLANERTFISWVSLSLSPTQPPSLAPPLPVYLPLPPTSHNRSWLLIKPPRTTIHPSRNLHTCCRTQRQSSATSPDPLLPTAPPPSSSSSTCQSPWAPSQPPSSPSDRCPKTPNSSTSSIRMCPCGFGCRHPRCPRSSLQNHNNDTRASFCIPQVVINAPRNVPPIDSPTPDVAASLYLYPNMPPQLTSSSSFLSSLFSSLFSLLSLGRSQIPCSYADHGISSTPHFNLILLLLEYAPLPLPIPSLHHAHFPCLLSPSSLFITNHSILDTRFLIRIPNHQS